MRITPIKNSGDKFYQTSGKGVRERLSMDNMPKKPIEIINDKYNELTRTQKRIADFILNNLNETSFMTLTEFCEEVSITAVTMGRFTKAIGYCNFGELKKDLQAYVREAMMPKKDLLKGFDPNTHVKSFSEFYHSVALDEIRQLEYSYNLLSAEDMRQTLSIIENASKVYLAGYGACAHAVELLRMRFVNMGIEVECLEVINAAMFSSQLYKLTEADALIAFSFPNYISDIITAVKYAASIKTKIICLTDKPTSTAAQYADISLIAKTDNSFFFNSMTVPVSICNTISTLLYWKSGSKSGTNDKRYEEIYTMVSENAKKIMGNENNISQISP